VVSVAVTAAVVSVAVTAAVAAAEADTASSGLPTNAQQLAPTLPGSHG
jgi:hypothetical protein